MLKLKKTGVCLKHFTLVHWLTSSLFSSLGTCSCQLVSILLYKREKSKAIVLKVVFESGSFELYEF